jgi:6-phosphogluconolactonase
MYILKLIIVASFFLFACKEAPYETPNENIDDKTIETTDSTTVDNNTVTDSITDEGNTDTLQVDKFVLYIGTYTDGTSKGIYLSEFDNQTGKITTPKLLTTLINPSYQCITSDNNFLWTVSEDWGGPGKVINFSINPQNGELSQTASFLSKGNAPCYVSYHQSTNNALVANYNSGNVINIPVNASGKANGTIYSDQHTGSGPNTNRQNEPHAHFIKPDLDEKYVYSANLGTDKIYVYCLVNNELDRISEIEMLPGSGPRHIAFHPSRKAMAVISELNSTVTVFTPDNEGIFNILLETKSTLPADYMNNNQCADIHFSPDGNYLYASNRGHNSIAVYKVDEETMKIELTELYTKDINWPRNFLITPNGEFLIVANQNSNSIEVLKRNIDTGKLTQTEFKQHISKPVCVTLYNLNK